MGCLWLPCTRRVRAANLKHVRFGEKSIVCSFRKISHAQHRRSSKSWVGAKGGAGAAAPEGLPPGRGQGESEARPNLHSPGGRTQKLHNPRPGKPSPKRCREARRLPDFIPQRRRVRREEQIPRRQISFAGAEIASDIFRRVRRSRARRKMSLAESLCPLAGRDFQRRLAARPAAQPVDAAIWMLNPPVNPSTSSISPQR